MFVTAKDFHENFNKYLELVKQEDIIITDGGKDVAVMSKASEPLSEYEELRNGYIKTFGKQPEEWQEQLMRDITSDNTDLTSEKDIKTSSVDYLAGLLAGKRPPDLDKKQIREMRLTERYDSNNA